MARGVLVAVVLLAAAGCRAASDAPDVPAATSDAAAASPGAPADDPPPHARELATLLAFEEQRRAATDFAALPPSDSALGPDPYRIAALPGAPRMVGLLRGESALVTLDLDGAEQQRLPAPRAPSGLAVSADGDVLVVGEDARELVQYRTAGAGLARVATLPVDALGLRDVALAPDGSTAYVVEEREGRLLALSLARERTGALRAAQIRELGRCHGPVQVVAVPGHVAVNCLLDHVIEVRREGRQVARIQHDGPLWSLALLPEPDAGVLVAAGGVEDHPLEREDGGFGYIDSFVYLYRLAPDAAAPQRLAAIDTSALGLVTPKWLALHRDAAGAVTLTATGYGSGRRVTLTWAAGELAAPPRIAQADLPPGTAAAALTPDGGLVAANPLLDAWVLARGDAVRVVASHGAQPPRPVASRLGELLFFTTLLSPWNSAEGKLSRFTCETCHFEGYGDGRTHYTGRGDVHATTRPLLGLFNDRPYFSRALDKTMARMVHAEVRVANRHNGRDPWFALTAADVPWLRAVPDAPAVLSPEALRAAFMTFLMDFTPRANPAALDHTRFTPSEAAGARVFRDRCAGCHAPRLVADDAASTVPFARWEALVLSPAGPIVWGQDRYEQTGVTPYVHDLGARIPSLRRLYKKWPYFTNGSARSLAEVLDGFAADAHRTFHAGAPPDAGVVRLTAAEKAALLAFLPLL